ncbi:MAG TPA: hypothetical protein P5525_11160 [Candidatus Paceibacterota bacterium]|nr:hypothetical protein [Candidatus Paceibacterota bacterium]
MKLETAERFSRQLVGELEPYCHRIEVAGSIRRRCPVCNDIDLVVIPRDLAALKKRCLQRCTPITRGDAIFSIQVGTGIQVDFFFARPAGKDLAGPVPSNWGSILLQRTGSKEHNMYLARRATDMGLQWRLSVGIVNAKGAILGGEDEESMFRALDLDFVTPERRER